VARAARVTAAVEIAGIDKRFGDTVALADVSLVIAEREFVSLLGASGCGKSTLLRIVAGFELPTRGRVRIFGEDVTDRAPHRRPTNIVFQRGALFPHMNVFDNIAYSLKLKRWPRKRIAEKVEEMLALVRLEGFAGREPTELSGGQTQRVALARALAAEPSVLLLDETLSALDLKLRQQMQLELRAIQRRLGATFVFVTHDQTEALVMSDRIAIMNEGRIVQLGTPREIYTRPASVFASSFIGETNLLSGTVVSIGERSATLRIGEGALVTAERSSPLPVGAAATLSVRPEAIRVSRCAGGKPGLPATVREMIYLGSSIRVGSAIAGGQIVWADLRDEEANGLAPGAEVSLSWAPGAAMMWEGGGDG
jgi:spermidine/putrescine ABC transporter ATP-binding subunit